MAITNILDHAARSLARLVNQFKDSPRIKGLLSVVSSEAQAIETALQDVLAAQRDVTVATGTTLDNLGALIGAPVRGTKNDTQYRARVTAQVDINRSSGESASVYAIAKSIVAAWNVSGQPKVTEHKPAHYTVAPSGNVRNDTDQARELAQILNGPTSASSAGVRAIVMSRSNTVPSGGFFRFAGGAGPAAGFGVGAFRGAYDK